MDVSWSFGVSLPRSWVPWVPWVSARRLEGSDPARNCWNKVSLGDGEPTATCEEYVNMSPEICAKCSNKMTTIYFRYTEKPQKSLRRNVPRMICWSTTSQKQCNTKHIRHFGICWAPNRYPATGRLDSLPICHASWTVSNTLIAGDEPWQRNHLVNQASRLG